MKIGKRTGRLLMNGATFAERASGRAAGAGRVRVLSLIEALTVTGPARALIDFRRTARSDELAAEGLPRVEGSFATFRRGGTSVDEQSQDQFISASRAAGVEVDVIEERFRFDTRVVGELRRVVARRAPDIIETHGTKSHFIVKLSGLGQKLPWVAFHHGYTTTDAKMRVYNQLDRWSLPSAARVVTVCGPFAEQLARVGVEREKILVRHNSIGTFERAGGEEVAALKERLGVQAGERVILAVGRLSREKGHADLLGALGVLRELNPDLNFKLVVAGDGPERGRLEEAARGLGLAERVVFAGHAGDVRPFYALADALALPSHSEGSPLVLLEAMAEGLPVAATAVGGVPEIVSDGESALLAPPRDAAALAEALRRLLSDAALASRIADEARRRVRSHFTPEDYARALVETYRGLLRRAGI
ncbi:MAG TPA: glycosyltransferase [Pyrinomonadaceae bacterium]|nr:glycosyltransferase [Pyrinomonadaceae bacterium]